ncbi:methyltransferase domain-containing protein [Oligoflexia bacterium]|nr:methyltransferase domain-containing protein [Oligoflexia bacterium]
MNCRLMATDFSRTLALEHTLTILTKIIDKFYTLWFFIILKRRYWREGYFKLLSGKGLELGALHLPSTAPHLEIQYVDRMTVAELKAQYPELDKKQLTNVDIVDDAETLASIADNSQDFVIATHIIEHMKNPIGALLAWQRVLKPGGRLFLAAPDKDLTFDKERDTTTVEHVVADYEDPSDTRDFEAYKEFALHVSCRIYKVRPEEKYQQLAQELWDTQYSIHYHAWNLEAFTKLLDHMSNQLEAWSMRCIDYMPTKKKEFIFILEKLYLR